MKLLINVILSFVLFLLLLGCQTIETNTSVNYTGINEDTSYGKWIWYPGDRELYLLPIVTSRRVERGQSYPIFWRMDPPYPLVRFEKNFELPEPDTVQIYVQGQYHIRLDGKIIQDFDLMNFAIPAGRHDIRILVENHETFPAILVKGKQLYSDNTWRVNNQSIHSHFAASDDSNSSNCKPEYLHMEYKPITANVLDRNDHSLLLDFGKETFGKVIIESVKGKGKLTLFYGETKQEALARKEAETYDIANYNTIKRINDTTVTRAFRYILAEWDKGIKVRNISALYEYLPVDYRGSFECSDSLLNRIYDVSLYTLHLTTREFHLDGIKRDRWPWSGDAYQSYLMNFYTFFDENVNKRTIYALRGHDPMESHINTILDYSYYWLIGIYDHYLYTGDLGFVKEIYPRMKTLTQFCLNRFNENGLVEGQHDDWVFLDWAPIDKKGELSFYQILAAKALQVTAICAEIANDKEFANSCHRASQDLESKIFSIFWNDNKGALVHNRKEGKLSVEVTRYANMFAVLFNYTNEKQKQSIKENVILNDEVLQISTPYMRYYELAALCEIGEKKTALDFVRNYWGGMLTLDATSFWEAYDPTQSGVEHYAMYNRPFGKSLCHAWGANPVYLFGKYLLGVEPIAPGYRKYIIEPDLGGLEWINGTVPTPNGNIKVYMNKEQIKVKPVEGICILKIASATIPTVKNAIKITNKGDNLYEIELDASNDEYIIGYNPIL